MREHFTRGWWQVFIGAMVVGAVVGLGIGVIVGAGVGGAAGSPTRLAGTVSKRVADRRPPVRYRCGGFCVSLYSRLVGTVATISVAHGLRDQDGQFTISLLARVGQFCGTDKRDFFSPGGFLCRRESGFRVVEMAWSPYGHQPRLCVGVRAARRGGERVVLRPCGVDARTLWIADQFHPAGTSTGRRSSCLAPGAFCPLINGADVSFTKPLVLAVDSASRSAAYELRMERLALVSGTARSRPATRAQEFSFTFRP